LYLSSLPEQPPAYNLNALSDGELVLLDQLSTKMMTEAALPEEDPAGEQPDV
jgi:hypothetical protein